MKLTDNEAKFEELLTEYREMVKAKAHLYYMFGGDIEDIIQEGMIGLYKAIQSYDETKGATFATYADRLVDRQIQTALKNASRKKNVPLNSSVSFSVPMGDTPNSKTLGETVAAGSDSDPEMRLVIEELPRIIMAEDSKILSKMERQVFSYMLEGKDYKSIAEIMGKSPKSIDNCIQRIRSKIKHFLEE